MPNIKLEFPEVIVTEGLKENGAFNLKTNTELVKKITSEAFRGVIDKDGKWGITLQGDMLSPGGGWDITHKEVGVYKVTHVQGYYNISLSVTILQSPGTIEVLENHPNYFVVKTSIEGTPYDMPWAFTLVRVISQPSEPQKPTTQNSFSRQA